MLRQGLLEGHLGLVQLPETPVGVALPTEGLRHHLKYVESDL